MATTVHSLQLVPDDAVVIERGKAWINFLDELLPTRAPNAWVLSLQSDDRSAVAIESGS